MLMIRKYKENESKEIIDLLTREKINDVDLKDYLYIAIEDDVIIGACKIKIEDEKGFLKYIVVKESNRGEMLGDGIFRATLNNLEKNGVRKVYFNGVDTYLLKMGFIEKDDNNLELILSEFFKPSCECSGNCKQVL